MAVLVYVILRLEDTKMLSLGYGLSKDDTGLAEIFSNKYSILLNGSTQYIDLSSAASQVSPLKGTISAWCRITDSTSINGVVFKASVDSQNFITIMYHNATAQLRFTYKGGNVVAQAAFETEMEGEATWVHVAQTWNTSADQLKAYVDGNQVGGTQASLGTFAGTIDEIYSGANTIAANSYWLGNIDEMAIFDQPLTVAEIGILYNGGSPKDVEFSGLKVGPVAYWRMEEGTSDGVLDSIGNRDGVLVNDASWSTAVP